jgi:hypothetical protein
MKLQPRTPFSFFQSGSFETRPLPHSRASRQTACFHLVSLADSDPPFSFVSHPPPLFPLSSSSPSQSKKSKDAAASTTASAPQEQKRTLGLVILRGETVVSIAIEGPPPKADEDSAPSLPLGPGTGVAAGRGMGVGGGSPFLLPSTTLTKAYLLTSSRGILFRLLRWPCCLTCRRPPSRHGCSPDALRSTSSRFPRHARDARHGSSSRLSWCSRWLPRCSPRLQASSHGIVRSLPAPFPFSPTRPAILTLPDSFPYPLNSPGAPPPGFAPPGMRPPM